MKKIAAILIAALFMFNWFGYRILVSLLENQANSSLQTSLDQNDYIDADLISIKIPVNLPYYTNSTDYSRIDGEIEINGTHYNYVKCRLYNDSIEYLCIPNKAKMKIGNARDKFFELVNDLQHSSPNKKHNAGTHTVKNLLTEYNHYSAEWCLAAYKPLNPDYNSAYLCKISSSVPLAVEQPPDAWRA